MRNKLEKKLSFGIVTIAVLFVCLCVTTFALVYASVKLEGSTVSTGYVTINLNDGAPIVQEGEFLFEPGATVQKTFFLENTSTCDVWFRFYFENVSGELKDVIEVTVKDGETVLYAGKMTELTKNDTKTVPADETAIAKGEKREFTISFTMPADTGNDSQGTDLIFDLVAEAVQTKNNTGKTFNG